MLTSLRVVVVEEKPAEVERMILQLSQAGFVVQEWRRIEDEEEYLHALEGRPDVILSAWELPRFSGQRALQLLTERSLDIPFIIVSASIGEEAAINAMQLGAYDYVHKDRLARLGPAVGRALELYHTRQERSRAEAALRESEQKFRFIAEAIADIVWTLGLDAQTTYVSPAIKRALGFTPEERERQALSEIMTPESLARMEATLAEEVRLAQEPGADPDRTVTTEVEYYHKDGTTVWMENGTKVMRDAAGVPIGILGVSRDITERKRAAEALARQEAELRATLYSISDAIIATDMERRIVRMNPSAERLTGWSEAEAAGKPLDEVFRPVDEKTRRPVEYILRDGVTVELSRPTLLIARDGQEIPIAVSVAPIFDPQGKKLGAVLVLRDQSEQRLSRRLLETHLALIEYAAGHTLDELLTKVVDEIEAFTGSAMGFCGFVAPDQTTLTRLVWSTRTLPEFCRVEGEAVHSDRGDGGVWEKAIAAKGPVIMNDCRALASQGKMPAGHPELKRMVVVPIIRGDKAVTIVGVGNKPADYAPRDAESVFYLANVMWEIVQRKQAEEDREKLQKQLWQAQKMESIGRLAGGVAHDFNNMLTVIQGYTQIALAQLRASDPLYQDLEQVRTAAQRSTELTRQLLTFARRQPISPQVLDLNETVDGMLKMLRRLIGEDIQLLWTPGEALWRVKIDPVQVDQLLANLVVNARDAIAGVGTVAIETANVVVDEAYCATHAGFTPGEYVLLSVSDTGCGMSKEVLEHLFEPFFTTKESGKGTGLGLSTVYGIVKQNNGFVNVYSELGQGSTFRIYFPRCTEAPAEKRAKPEKRGLQGGSETILLVEDEPTILELGRRILEELGYTVLATTRPQEAIRLAQEHAGVIHLLITDLVMPEMNGRELAEKLTRLRPGMPYLYTSGYAPDILLNNGMLAKKRSFIRKPFSVEELASAVRQALDVDRF